MAVAIHFKDATVVTNPNWQGATEAEPDGHFISITGGGGIPMALVPTCNVQYVDLNS